VGALLLQTENARAARLRPIRAAARVCSRALDEVGLGPAPKAVNQIIQNRPPSIAAISAPGAGWAPPLCALAAAPLRARRRPSARSPPPLCALAAAPLRRSPPHAAAARSRTQRRRRRHTPPSFRALSAARRRPSAPLAAGRPPPPEALAVQPVRAAWCRNHRRPFAAWCGRRRTFAPPSSPSAPHAAVGPRTQRRTPPFVRPA